MFCLFVDLCDLLVDLFICVWLIALCVGFCLIVLPMLQLVCLRAAFDCLLLAVGFVVLLIYGCLFFGVLLLCFGLLYAG